jgi:hypothetical protein
VEKFNPGSFLPKQNFFEEVKNLSRWRPRFTGMTPIFLFGLTVKKIMHETNEGILFCLSWKQGDIGLKLHYM